MRTVCDDYLPYGTLFNDTAPQLGNNRYLYGGKELQEGLGVSWYDSGARFQTVNGVFTGIDPLAEKYYGISPYAYLAGNSVNYVDERNVYSKIVPDAKYDELHLGHVFNMG